MERFHNASDLSQREQTSLDQIFYDHQGFTLLELMVALVLIALVAGTVTVSLRGHLGNARAELAIETLQLIDRHSRDSALRTGRERSLRWNLARGTIVRVESGRSDTLVSDNLPIVRVWSDETGLTEANGSVELRFRPDGTSPSYALCLKQNQQLTTWLLFAGLTGHALRTPDSAEVEELLRR